MNAIQAGYLQPCSPGAVRPGLGSVAAEWGGFTRQWWSAYIHRLAEAVQTKVLTEASPSLHMISREWQWKETTDRGALQK